MTETPTYYRVLNDRQQRESIVRLLQDTRTGIDGVCHCLSDDEWQDAAIRLDRVLEQVTNARSELRGLLAGEGLEELATLLEATDAP